MTQKQKIRLYGLSDAVIDGESLLFVEVLENQSMNQLVIPILALHDLGIVGVESINVSRIEVPEEIDLWEMEENAVAYIENLPKIPLAQLKLNPYSQEMRFKMEQGIRLTHVLLSLCQ